MENPASSRFLRNLEPNEHVRHLCHSSRVHDPRFNWMKGLSAHCNVRAHDEILVVLCTDVNSHEHSCITPPLETVHACLAKL